MSTRPIHDERGNGDASSSFAYIPRRILRAVHARSEATGRIVRVSPLGMMVACAGHRWPVGPAEVALPMLHRPVAAHVDSVDDGIANVRFVDLGAESVRDILEWIHSAVARGEAGTPPTRTSIVEHIRDGPRIAALLKMFAERTANARVLSTRGSRTTSVHARWDRMGHLLVAGAVPRGTTSVETYGPWSVYSFEGDGAEPVQPTSIVRLRRRHTRRVEVGTHVRVHIRRRTWPEPSIERDVQNVSIGGLAFETDAVDDALFPGGEVEFQLQWRGGEAVSGHGIVRHVTPDPAVQRGAVCGIEVVREPGDDGWARAIDELLHPSTEWGQTRPEELWNVYRESGYFNLSGKASDEFADLEEAFVKTHDLVVRSPHLGARFALRTRRGLEATIAQLEAWDGSWLVFQLGWLASNRALTSESEHVLHSLYMHAYEHLQTYARPRWLVSLVQDSARWSRRVHLDALRRHITTGQAMTVPFRALEFSTEATEQGAEGVTVDAPTASEYATLRQHLASIRHPLELAAFGLADPAQDVASLIQRWKDAGLGRWRKVLVAREADRFVAFAVLDAAQSGLHLFCLTDCMRLFSIEQSDGRAESALLHAAREWYRDLGHSRFVFFADGGEPPAWAIGARDLGGAHIGVLSANLIPEFLEHLAEVLAARHVREVPGNGR